MNKVPRPVGAVILAAGQSRRMGQPKLGLPWGNRTVIGQVVTELMAAGVHPIVVVTGGSREQVEQLLQGYPVFFLHNPDFLSGEMLESLQIGLRGMPGEPDACLVVLGDQPQIRSEVVGKILSEYLSIGQGIIIPSFQMKRGHPWLVDRELWSVINEYKSPNSLRDFLVDQASQIRYVGVDEDSILLDLDTPEDYEKRRPKSS